MPYMQLPQIDDRKNEKIAAFLTAENLAGLLLLAGPIYLATNGWSLWPRALLLLAAAVIGVSLTVPISGMALYRRIFWRVRGWVWRRLTMRDLLPEDFPGAAHQVRTTRALPQQGLARPLRNVLQQAQQSAATRGRIDSAAGRRRQLSFTPPPEDPQAEQLMGDVPIAEAA